MRGRGGGIESESATGEGLKKGGLKGRRYGMRFKREWLEGEPLMKPQSPFTQEVSNAFWVSTKTTNVWVELREERTSTRKLTHPRPIGNHLDPDRVGKRCEVQLGEYQETIGKNRNRSIATFEDGPQCNVSTL